MSLRAAIERAHPDFRSSGLSDPSWERLEKLALASPLYGRTLAREPGVCLWLEAPDNRDSPYRWSALEESWGDFEGGGAPSPDSADGDQIALGRLRRWRRRMSLRIAHRSVAGLAGEPETVAELSRLAEFCLARAWDVARLRWCARLGTPWNPETGKPARFCILGLGKLGGRELNFSSDIDLVYVYDADGYCRRSGAQTSASNAECFTRAAESLTGFLNTRTSDGFLFRADARLRPEGDCGPLVRSALAVEAYYASAGQTWERLALVKARPVGGDISLGDELLEELHAFRYPLRPPPSLLGEVAAMKARTESELLGEEGLSRNVKLGRGGIREVEFVAQSLQLLNAGRYPFLQTNATVEALAGLARYRLLPAQDAVDLSAAYWFLRAVENRIQMREEEQTHSLPSDSDGLASLAGSLGFPSPAEFLACLDGHRSCVRGVYADLFADQSFDQDLEDWWTYLTTERTPAALRTRLARWFGPEASSAAADDAVRLLACGERHAVITREGAVRFQGLARAFDLLMPTLAEPVVALGRLNRFATRYGTRREFLSACADNPPFLRLLALLCDRSAALAELLCVHPEIIEEVARPEMLRRRKLPRDLDDELSGGLSGEDPGAWLRLYVRAEQARHILLLLLGDLDLRSLEAELTALADAVLRALLAGEPVVVVALGRHGGAELGFGSDLDLVFVAPEGREERAEAAVRRVCAALRSQDALGPVYTLDLRLRPHGDAGPLVTNLPSLEAYHSGGGAQSWERQVLLSARIVAGDGALAAQFESWREQLLFAGPLSEADAEALWAMRARIQEEHAPEAGTFEAAAFKTGPGGLADIEFLVRGLQLARGWAHPARDAVRSAGTHAALHALALAGLIPAPEAAALLENLDFLRRLEWAVRLNTAAQVGLLPGDAAGRRHLAHRLGYGDARDLLADAGRHAASTRAIVLRLGGPAASALLRVPAS